MKNTLKLFLVNTIFLSLLYVFTPSILQAEVIPDYKEEALRRCYAQCERVFDDPILRQWCRAGCVLGLS